jgi:hypothetical protein
MKNNVRDLLKDHHYLQALDRTLVITEMIDTHLIHHPVFKAEKAYSKKISEVGFLLTEAYQILKEIKLNNFK